MLAGYDYAICPDLEFTGGDPIRNQITSIGLALLDVNRMKLTDSCRIGDFHLEPAKTWSSKCRTFWDSVPDMKKIAVRIDAKENTMPLASGIEQMVKQVRQWETDLQRLHAPKVIRFCWLTDTVAADVTHLNYSLAFYGYPTLDHFFNDTYDDVKCTKEYRAQCLGVGFTRDALKNHVLAPKNRNAHDPESDARFIAESMLFYTRVFAQETHKQSRHRKWMRWLILLLLLIILIFIASTAVLVAAFPTLHL